MPLNSKFNRRSNRRWRDDIKVFVGKTMADIGLGTMEIVIKIAADAADDDNDDDNDDN